MKILIQSEMLKTDQLSKISLHKTQKVYGCNINLKLILLTLC